MSYRIVLFKKIYDRSGFSCGIASLDRYLQTQINQDMKRSLSAAFVMLRGENNTEIIGYYTLSSSSLKSDAIPESARKNFPGSYKILPVTLLGRLAVDNEYKQQGLGGMLLADALKRSFEVAENSVGSIAVIVDPIDYNAALFYKKFGFISLANQRRMFLPMKVINKLLDN